MPGNSLDSCYALWDGKELTIGNEHVCRVWKVKNGLLFAQSLFDVDTETEWFAKPSERPSVQPNFSLPDEPRQVKLEVNHGTFGATQNPSLTAEFTAAGESLTLRYRFQVFPNSHGVTTQFSTESSFDGIASTGTGTRATKNGAPSGVEMADIKESKSSFPTLDIMEFIELKPQHIKIRQVRLKDQTDIHNELVFENEWLLHTNEHNLQMQGNLFILEDVLTRSGLIYLKHAPLPHARPYKNDYDLKVDGTTGAFYAGRQKDASGQELPIPAHTYQCAFYGHGAGDSGEGYPYVLLTYDGGRAGIIETLQTYQRQFRTYQSGRDGLFLSNTWGDRSRDAKIKDHFIRLEVESGSRLGVDVIQIDDGWEKGITANSVNSKQGGVWEGFWAANPEFWEVNRDRFPEGLEPLISDARKHGMGFGLWFAPDSSEDFAHWHEDAQTLLNIHRELGVNYFKIDGVKARTKTGETNLLRFFDEVLQESHGKVVFDLDVTAEIRPGYFGMMHVGPIFVENRYTDYRRYWPHHTLRNLWKLAQYVDPLRLRMEFLSNERNADVYQGDLLAPSEYRPDYLFATTMFSNPLGWFEVSNLSEDYVQAVASVAKVWKQHRDGIFGGTILPIGDVPDGTAWTGFFSIDNGKNAGYLLLFREFNQTERWEMKLPMLHEGTYSTVVLAGRGSAQISNGRLFVEISNARDFVFVKIQATS